MYQFRFEYEFEDFLVFNRVDEKINGPLTRILLALFTALVANTVIGVGLYFAGKVSAIPLTLVVVTASTIGLSFHPISSERLARASQKRTLENLGEITITLDENEVQGHTGKGDSQYPWNAFVCGYHCRGRYFLLLDKRHTVILPERAIVEGDPATLKAFLEEKLQKEIKEIR